jgi:hypothetical protein
MGIPNNIHGHQFIITDGQNAVQGRPAGGLPQAGIRLYWK